MATEKQQQTNPDELPRRTLVFTESMLFPYGGGVFSGRCVDPGPHHDHPYQVVIMNNPAFPKGARLPQPGDVWQVTGKFKPHPANPKIWQMHAVTCRMFKPNGKLFFYFLRNNKAFRGLYIGEKKWEAIFSYFRPTPDDMTGPARLKKALDDADISVFVDNELLSAELAGRLIAAWRAIDRNEINVITYLQEKGIDHGMATRLIKVWGTDTIANLEKNPYYLVAFIEHWKHVDELAIEVYKIARNDPRRLVGAVIAALKERLFEGKHTLTQYDELLRLVRLRLRITAKATLDTAIDLALQKGVIVGSREAGYQLDGAAALEKRVQKMLEALYQDTIPRQEQILFSPPSRTFVDKIIAATEQELGFPLNDEQRQAVHMAMENRVSVLCGGAGCGKTAVLRAILNCIKAMNGSFFQLALAGRAATRMTASTNEEALTIARFLHYTWNNLCDLDGDPYIIIDEASMLDLTSMDRILRAIARGAKLLFVGDEAQLPPISFGLVFHRLVQSNLIPHTRLVKVVRSTDESGIADLAQLIREKQVPEKLTAFPWGESMKAVPGVFFEPCLEDKLALKVKEIFNILQDDENTQVISLMNRGVGSTEAVNIAIQDLLDERYKRAHRADRPTFIPNPQNLWERWSLGDRVMYLENNLELGLNNGTLGKITEVNGDNLICEFEGAPDPITIVITPDTLDKITLAFSITCHKGQGSQWKRIIIPLVDLPWMLENSWIYTALTRGIEQVIFVGNWRTLSKAIESRSQAELREVAFDI